MTPPSPDNAPTSPAFAAGSTPADLPYLTLRFLEHHEAPCPACGYNVHRVTEPRCPECGRALRLRLVALTPNAPLPWIILLTATSVGAGIGLFILAILTSEHMPRELHWRIILTYFLCNIPLPAIVFFLRKPMRRLAGVTLWIAPLLMSLATIAMTAWFLRSIMRP